MPFNPNLDIEITDGLASAIETDLLASKNGLGAIAVITLSKAEREPLNGVDNKRLPYVQRAVDEFGPDYPTLVSQRVNLVRAGKLLPSLLKLRSLDAQLDEYKDRVKDLSDNIEELLYEYTIDMYYTAQRYRGTVEGADIVADYLSELFESQGVQNPAPATP